MSGEQHWRWCVDFVDNISDCEVEKDLMDGVVSFALFWTFLTLFLLLFRILLLPAKMLEI